MSDLHRRQRRNPTCSVANGWIMLPPVGQLESDGSRTIFARLVKLERLGRVALLALMLLAVDRQATAQPESFDAWLAQFREEAAAEGISATTLDQALDGLAHADAQ